MAAGQSPLDPMPGSETLRKGQLLRRGLLHHRHGVRRARSPPADLEERQIVLGIAEGLYILEGQAEESQGALDSRALGDARRQQHQRATVVHGIATHVRRRQRLLDWPFVATGGSDNDAPDLIGDPAAIQLGQKSIGRRRTLIPDHRRPGIVEHRAVLGDDGVEELKAVTDAAQLEEGAPRDENEPQPRLPGMREGFPYRRGDPVAGCQSAVEIERQRLEDHVCRRMLPTWCVGGA